MHLEGVATIPRCAECEAHWLPADEARWQAWLTDDEPRNANTRTPTPSVRTRRPQAARSRSPSPLTGIRGRLSAR
jgi:hypothetical protein